MRIIKAKNYDEMSLIAASIIGGQILLKPDSILGLATGSSPIGTYKELVANYKKGILDFSQVKTVNLDEYVGVSPDNENSYRYFMNENLFDHTNIDKENTHVPNGVATDVAAECDRYDKLIASLGRIDLQLLGIGMNGHIGFNEPADYFPTGVHEVELTESTIQSNSRLFDRPEDVPKTAVTMGVGAIMNAHKVLLIAGAEKADIIDATVNGRVTPEVPASILQLHPDATIILCES